MKITKVTPMVLGTNWRDLTFVKVETDEGLTGVGEARVLNRTEAVLGYSVRGELALRDRQRPVRDRAAGHADVP